MPMKWPNTTTKTANWPMHIGPKGPRINKAGFAEAKIYTVQDLGDDKHSRVGKKISKLIREGEPQAQAVATALNMERKHRLTESGRYKRVKK